MTIWNSHIQTGTPPREVSLDAYVNLTEAEDILSIYPDRSAIWSTMTATQRQENLLRAAQLVDRFNYVGKPTLPYQAGPIPNPRLTDRQYNKWPRVLEQDEQKEGQIAIDDKTVPYDIEKANALLAVTIFQDATNMERENIKDNLNVKLQKVGPLMRMFFHPTSVPRPAHLQQKDNEAFQCIIKWSTSEAVEIFRGESSYGTDSNVVNFYDQDYDRTVFGYGSSSGVRRVRGVSTA